MQNNARLDIGCTVASRCLDKMISIPLLSSTCHPSLLFPRTMSYFTPYLSRSIPAS